MWYIFYLVDRVYFYPTCFSFWEQNTIQLVCIVWNPPPVLLHFILTFIFFVFHNFRCKCSTQNEWTVHKLSFVCRSNLMNLTDKMWIIVPMRSGYSWKCMFLDVPKKWCALSFSFRGVSRRVGFVVSLSDWLVRINEILTLATSAASLFKAL